MPPIFHHSNRYMKQIFRNVRRIGLIGIAFITICLALCIGSYGSVAGWEIEALQKEINTRGYQWKAGKTSLSHLSSEERKSMLGLILPKKIQMVPEAMRFALPYSQPTSFDWRNVNGENWITPVKNQKSFTIIARFRAHGVKQM